MRFVVEMGWVRRWGEIGWGVEGVYGIVRDASVRIISKPSYHPFLPLLYFFNTAYHPLHPLHPLHRPHFPISPFPLIPLAPLVNDRADGYATVASSLTKGEGETESRGTLLL